MEMSTSINSPIRKKMFRELFLSCSFFISLMIFARYASANKWRSVSSQMASLSVTDIMVFPPNRIPV